MKKVKPFSLSWWMFLAFAAISIILLPIIFAGQPREIKLHFILYLSVFQLIFLFVYKYLYVKTNPGKTCYFNELPCFLCNLSTCCCIIGSLLDNRFFQGFCISVGFIGALLAFIMPDPDFINIDLISIKTFGFYGYHSLIIISCLSFLFMGIYTPDIEDIGGILLIELGCLILAHLTNYIVRKTKLCTYANYMFTYEATNSVIAKFYKLIPIKGVYLLPLLPLFSLVFVIETIIYNIIK